MSDDNKEGAGVPVRECGNGECGWKGATDRMLGSIGPLCPECGETTEPAVMPAAPSDAAMIALDDLEAMCKAGEDSGHSVMHIADVRSSIEGLRAALSQTMQPQAGAVYVDSAPHLHIGDSAFEDWYQNYLPNSVGHKQIARDAYAAGMGDPLVVVAPAAGEQAARNWIHGEAIDYLEVPDVQDESGINAHYSRDLVLQCIDAAIEAGKEQAGAMAQTPMFFASAEQANALQDRPDDDEGGVYLPLRKTAAGKFTMPLYAAPGAAIAAREQDECATCVGTGTVTDKGFGSLATFKDCPDCTASRGEAPDTPQAAPNDALREVGRAWARTHGHEYPGESADAYVEGHRAALTQPATVQQAEPTDEQMEQIADAIWGVQKKRLPMSAAIEFARAVLALKGMQPGERKEGV